MVSSVVAESVSAAAAWCCRGDKNALRFNGGCGTGEEEEPEVDGELLGPVYVGIGLTFRTRELCNALTAGGGSIAGSEEGRTVTPPVELVPVLLSGEEDDDDPSFSEDRACGDAGGVSDEESVTVAAIEEEDEGSTVVFPLCIAKITEPSAEVGESGCCCCCCCCRPLVEVLLLALLGGDASAAPLVLLCELVGLDEMAAVFSGGTEAEAEAAESGMFPLCDPLNGDPLPLSPAARVSAAGRRVAEGDEVPPAGRVPRVCDRPRGRSITFPDELPTGDPEEGAMAAAATVETVGEGALMGCCCCCCAAAFAAAAAADADAAAATVAEVSGADWPRPRNLSSS